MSSRAQQIAKRMLDVIVSGAAMILLWPLFALAALAIWANMGRPVLFRQARAGYRAKPFTPLKFRTMSEACDSEGNLLPDPDRLTRLGSFLRRWSLDELPLLMEYLERYTSEQARRHDVKPGLTGWAQLHGRQDLLFSKRFEMDVWYVDHRGFLLDLKLIFTTLLRLHRLSAAGPNPDGDKTDDMGLFALIRKPRKKGDPVSLP
jgi:sugar transferase EpsL